MNKKEMIAAVQSKRLRGLFLGHHAHDERMGTASNHVATRDRRTERQRAGRAGRVFRHGGAVADEDHQCAETKNREHRVLAARRLRGHAHAEIFAELYQKRLLL